jgi:hypothetical protein
LKKWEQEAVRLQSRKDPDDNAATRLPSGEQALMPVFWLAEVFTPTTIANLVKGIRNLVCRARNSQGYLC